MRGNTAQVSSVPWTLSFYLKDPTVEIDIEELERAALSRLQILKDIEMYQGLQERGKNSVLQLKVSEYSKKLGDTEDLVGHFMLKLAFCRDEALSRWFVDLESKLFKHRLGDETSAIAALKYELGIIYDELTADERRGLRESDQRFLGTGVYYKVPLRQAAVLLNKKGVLPWRGQVLLPREQMKLLACELFRAVVLRTCAQAEPTIVDDIRISNLVTRLQNPSTDSLPSAKFGGTRVELASLDGFAHSHFPPCMKSLYFQLKQTHHLKHRARLQLGLFLKGIGLSYEDSLRMWRTEFTQVMTLDKFVKGYEYNIKHNYAKVGKMADYTPWGCQKLIHSAPASEGDSKGCPFKNSPPDELRRLLATYTNDFGVLAPLVEQGSKHPQVSCINLFKAVHPECDATVRDQVGHHPNAYFDASLKYAAAHK
jgi:DNA primase large subunit